MPIDDVQALEKLLEKSTDGHRSIEQLLLKHAESDIIKKIDVIVGDTFHNLAFPKDSKISVHEKKALYGDATDALTLAEQIKIFLSKQDKITERFISIRNLEYPYTSNATIEMAVARLALIPAANSACTASVIPGELYKNHSGDICLVTDEINSLKEENEYYLREGGVFVIRAGGYKMLNHVLQLPPLISSEITMLESLRLGSEAFFLLGGR